MNITLIGMPGSGKTYVGKILAQKIGFNFLDTDTLIENEYRLPLPKIIQNIGEKEFLQKEENVLISCTAGKNNLIISPGGSIIYSLAAMEHLKKISVIVYLKTNLPVIEARINNTPRGIIGAKTQTIAQIFPKDNPFMKNGATLPLTAINLRKASRFRS